jgi:hypothetical protein
MWRRAPALQQQVISSSFIYATHSSSCHSWCMYEYKTTTSLCVWRRLTHSRQSTCYLRLFRLIINNDVYNVGRPEDDAVVAMLFIIFSLLSACIPVFPDDGGTYKPYKKQLQGFSLWRLKCPSTVHWMVI